MADATFSIQYKFNKGLIGWMSGEPEISCTSNVHPRLFVVLTAHLHPRLFDNRSRDLNKLLDIYQATHATVHQLLLANSF